MRGTKYTRKAGRMGGEAMAESRAVLARRTLAFKPSPIQQLSLLAQRCNALNLAEGFPDFPAPPQIKEAAISAIAADFNQYRHVQGVCEKVAEAFEKSHSVTVDPTTQVTICCGQSEAMAAAVFAVVEEGDEVVLLDPAYETYEACIILAGGTPRYVALEPPYWTLDMKKLEAAFGPHTKAIVVNSPHNPTGKVFNERELAAMATLCCKYDCLAITDEVYEHITFDEVKHISMASFPGMQHRTIVTSSLSKTFSVTGGSPGCPPKLQDFLYAVEQYKERRNFVCKMLEQAGFCNFLKPQGSFFIFAELPPACRLNDVEYVAELIKTAGVAVVPGRGFFHPDQLCGPSSKSARFSDSCIQQEVEHSSANRAQGYTSKVLQNTYNYRERYVRIAFCKNMVTLSAADTAYRNYCSTLHCPQG